jgi:hypothetical protein
MSRPMEAPRIQGTIADLTVKSKRDGGWWWWNVFRTDGAKIDGCPFPTRKRAEEAAWADVKARGVDVEAVEEAEKVDE